MQLPVGLLVGLLARYRDIRRQVPIEIDPYAEQQLFKGICLTTDVSGYTALAARIEPAKLGPLLEEYFEVIRRVVTSGGGIVWGRGGDSSLCLWRGRTRSRLAMKARVWLGREGETDKALRMSACLSAIELRDAIESFNARHPQTHQLRTRIGLDAGEVAFGLVGGELQVVGTPPNAASRIQELNKRLATRVLASAAVVADLELMVRPLGSFTLPGIPDRVSIFEILGPLTTANEEDRYRCAQFAAALALYETQQWSAAARSFDQLAGTYPEDGPIDYYRDLCVKNMAATARADR